ncbi:MAG: hypothetical protein IJX39_02135 [Clostridia bacterium]|nr:hypothetical protein [Clostridia bacterium]
MASICESVMLICFGLSWPISVYKSMTSKSTKGKSLVFMGAILLGYIAGIIGKLSAGNINYVLALYIFNFTVVSVDVALYFINRKRERQEERCALTQPHAIASQGQA